MRNKHRLFIALLLAVCILFGSCNTANLPNENANATTPDTTAETTPTVNEDEAYLKIPVQECNGYTKKHYSIEGSSVAILLMFYANWEHQEDSNGDYLLLRDGVEIGRVLAGEAEDASEWKTISQKQANPAHLQVTEYLEKTGTGESLRFRHRFCYRFAECGSERVITLTLAYGEIDEYSQNVFRSDVYYKEHQTDPMYSTLSHLKDKPILVLGNSFVGSSEIGYIYNDIAVSSGKNRTMTAISRGYATVRSYSEDTALMNRIASGEWSAVFMCGFYGSEVQALGIIKKACDQSNTDLIIFPAHNEQSGSINSAIKAYPDLICIHWKREIEQLIKEGRSKWDFCINDQHLHSTPLAGYVGAMMIWRAIYGEMPKVRLYNTSDQMEYLAILGDYMNSPTFELMDPEKITFLK